MKVGPGMPSHDGESREELAAIAALPTAIGPCAEALPWLPAALLMALRVGHLAAASPVPALTEPSLEAVRSLLACLPTAANGADAQTLATAALVGRSAVATTLELVHATTAAQRAPLLPCALACVAALPAAGFRPDGGPSNAFRVSFTQVHSREVAERAATKLKAVLSDAAKVAAAKKGWAAKRAAAAARVDALFAAERAPLAVPLPYVVAGFSVLVALLLRRK